MKLSDLNPGDIIVRSRPSTGRSRLDMLEDCGVVLGRARPEVETSTGTTKRHQRVRVELPDTAPAHLGLRPGRYEVDVIAGRHSLERSPNQVIVAQMAGPRRSPRPDRPELFALATGRHIRRWSEAEASRLTVRWAQQLAFLGDRRERTPMLVFDRTDWSLGPHPRPEPLSRVPLLSDLRIAGHVYLSPEDRAQTRAGKVAVGNDNMAAVVDADLVLPDPGGGLLEKIHAAVTVAEVGPSLDRVAGGLRRLIEPADLTGTSRWRGPAEMVDVNEAAVTVPWPVLERLVSGAGHDVVSEILDVAAHLAELRTERAESSPGPAAAPPTGPS